MNEKIIEKEDSLEYGQIQNDENECYFKYDNETNFGIKKWNDGSKFLGYFKDSLANGWGILYNYDSEIFKAFFINNEVNGFGEYIHKNGNINIGYWEYDLQIGIGYEIMGDSCNYSILYEKILYKF